MKWCKLVECHNGLSMSRGAACVAEGPEPATHCRAMQVAKDRTETETVFSDLWALDLITFQVAIPP